MVRRLRTDYMMVVVVTHTPLTGVMCMVGTMVTHSTAENGGGDTGTRGLAPHLGGQVFQTRGLVWFSINIWEPGSPGFRGTP